MRTSFLLAAVCGLSLCAAAATDTITAEAVRADGGVREYEFDNQDIRLLTFAGRITVPLNQVTGIQKQREANLFTVQTSHGDSWLAELIDPELAYRSHGRTEQMDINRAPFTGYRLLQDTRLFWSDGPFMRMYLKDGSRVMLEPASLVLEVTDNAGARWSLPIGSCREIRFNYSGKGSDTLVQATFHGGSSEGFALIQRRDYIHARDSYGNAMKVYLEDLRAIAQPSHVVAPQPLPTRRTDGVAVNVRLNDGTTQSGQLPFCVLTFKTDGGTVHLPSPILSSLYRETKTDRWILNTVLGGHFRGRPTTRSLRLMTGARSAPEATVLSLSDISIITFGTPQVPAMSRAILWELDDGSAFYATPAKQHLSVVLEGDSSPMSMQWSDLSDLSRTKDGTVLLGQHGRSAIFANPETRELVLILDTCGQPLAVDWQRIRKARRGAIPQPPAMPALDEQPPAAPKATTDAEPAADANIRPGKEESEKTGHEEEAASRDSRPSLLSRLGLFSGRRTDRIDNGADTQQPAKPGPEPAASAQEAKPPAARAPEAAIQPEASSKPVVKSESKPETKPATEPESKPVAKPAPEPAPKPTAVPATAPEPTPVAKPAPESKPTIAPATLPEPTPAAVPATAPEPTPVAKPAPESKPTIAPATLPEPTPAAVPATAPEPTPVAKPEPRPVAVPAPAPAPKPVAKPAAAPEPKSAVAPATGPEPKPVAKPADTHTEANATTTEPPSLLARLFPGRSTTAANDKSEEPVAGSHKTADPGSSVARGRAPEPSAPPAPTRQSDVTTVAPGPSLGEVFVAGGTFMMGRTSGVGMPDEVPAHAVALSPFFIDDTEVTRGQFARFVEQTGYQTTGEQQRQATTWSSPGFMQNEDEPVVFVSWIDAAQYCNWRSREAGLSPCYRFVRNGTITCDMKANGYRLPTEAEWEYAARSKGADMVYPWLAASAQSASNDAAAIRFANFAQEEGAVGDGWVWTNPVRKFPANGLRLHGMAGNVWEWCEDWFFPNAYAAIHMRRKTDPCVQQNDVSGLTTRVMRGGSYRNDLDQLRCASRGSGIPNACADRVGFRCVRRP